jgi:uncharacterized repeat protein (TIGR02543 family)
VSARRSTGAIVGKIGQTTASAQNDGSVGGVVEYCINKADVRGTDKKGIGGIVGAAWNKGIVRYCANFGSVNVTNAGSGFLAGGIVGSSEVTILGCYNVGRVTAGSSSCAMAIGTNNGGSKVTDCYWLSGSAAGGGWYNGSMSDTITEFAAGQASAPKAASLGASAWVDAAGNGNASVNAYGGTNYPLLYFQSSTYAATEFTVSVTQPSVGGKVSVSKTRGRLGDTIYLTATPDSGYALDHFVVNGQATSDTFVTLNKNTTVTAVFREVEVEKITFDTAGADFTFNVTKTGLGADGQTPVTNQAVTSGSAVYEGDVLTIKVAVNSGAAPAAGDLEYSGTFRLTIVDASGKTVATLNGGKANGVTYTVKGTEGALVLSATLNTAAKSWESQADTSWYDASNPGAAYTLKSAAQLAGLAYLVNNEGVSFKGVVITLGANVSLADVVNAGTSRNWIGIGTSANPFKGTFNGGGHTVSNLYCTGANVGLFANVYSATIKNLTVEGTVGGTYIAGGVCASATASTFTDCVSKVEVVGTGTAVGGILGEGSATCTFKYCENNASVSGGTTAGGIAGSVESVRVTGSINKGDVSAASVAGGLIGHADGATVADSCNLGSVSSSATVAYSQACAGGLVGQDSGTLSVQNAYNSGAISAGGATSRASSVMAGGLFGCAKEASVVSVYNAGALSAKVAGALGVVTSKLAKADAAYFLSGSAAAGVVTSAGAGAAGASAVQAVEADAFATLADALGAYFTEGSAGQAGVEAVAAPVLLWQQASNRVTYVLNGGTNAAANIETQLQGQVLTLEAPTRAGFTFTGWYTNAALTNKVAALSASQKTDVVLYAGWQAAFADVAAGAWYETAVNYVAARGLIGGYTNAQGQSTGTYGVGDSMTRAQLATILWRYSCADEYAAYDQTAAVNSSGMKDVASGAYYTQAANWAKTTGVITGFDEGGNVYTFRPDTCVTFEQMVVIVARLCGSEAQIAAADTSVLGKFSDAASVSSWATQEMAWAVKAGLVEGYGGVTLAPGENVSRERASSLLYKAFNLGLLE